VTQDQQFPTRWHKLRVETVLPEPERKAPTMREQYPARRTRPRFEQSVAEWLRSKKRGGAT
jgi:hypothetical protein